MTLAVGLVHLITAFAYLMLMGFALDEQRRAGRVTAYTGALTVMFVGCGMHHFVHAEHALVRGERGSGLVLAALVLAAIPSVVFFALRIEARRDGRGDRLVAGSPAWLGLIPLIAALLAGALIALAVREALLHGTDLVAVGGNLVLLATYGTVGWYLLVTQVKRRPLQGGWSLSGISLGAIFPLCAFAHVITAITAPADIHTYLIDAFQVPASLFFLWAVRGLHRRAVRDLNRRPAVGRATRTSRRSPWAQPAAR